MLYSKKCFAKYFLQNLQVKIMIFTKDSGKHTAGVTQCRITIAIASSNAYRLIRRYTSQRHLSDILHKGIYQEIYFTKASIRRYTSQRHLSGDILHKGIYQEIYFTKASVRRYTSQRHLSGDILHKGICQEIYFTKASIRRYTSQRNLIRV